MLASKRIFRFKAVMLPRFLYVLGCLIALSSTLLALADEKEAFEDFHRGTDLKGWTAVDPGMNGHPSLLRPDAAVWSYWTAPRGIEWTEPDSWRPVRFAGPGEFRERATGEGEHRYFRLHDYYADADGFGVYWNRHPDLETSSLANSTLLAVFEAPEDGRYRLRGDLLWRHRRGPGINDGRIEIWRMAEALTAEKLTSADLKAPDSFDTFEPVPWFESPEGRTIKLSQGDRVVLRVVGSRSNFRGLEINDEGFRFRRLGPPPGSIPDNPMIVVRARQLQTLLNSEVPELAGFRHALEKGYFDEALALFEAAFLQSSAELRPVNLPTQWLYGATRAADVRAGKIRTLVYGGDETHEFAIGDPGEVPWDSLGMERYPLLLRDLSTMHWAAALVDSGQGAGDSGDAALWFGYWGDLAERWTVQYAAMLQDQEMVDMLPRKSLRWPGSAPLYFGWRLNNFFSWLPVASEQVERDDALAPDPMDLAAVLVWFASDEIPKAAEVLANPAGVPNQRRLLAAGLLQAGASMRWFRGMEAAVDGAKDFIAEMAQVEMLPDGGSLEQSLNYNKALPHEIDNYLEMDMNLPESWRLSTEMISFLQRSSAYRHAMIEALLRPDGTPPSIGKNNPYVSFNPWPEDLDSYPLSLALKKAFEGDVAQLAFTSVYFPWSGYAALREHWGPDAAYALFQNSRPGLGHHRESGLRLDISAFGAEMLVNSGAEQYSNQGNFNAYFNATVSQNSISVDGYSQLTQSRELDLPYEDPIPARWLSADGVDFIEGVYDGPYGGWNFNEHGSQIARPAQWEKEPKVHGINHRRRVLFLRNVPAWVVVDELKSEAQHRFTQTWNLAPRFGEGAVEVDADAARIRAVDGQAPSVEMLQIPGPGLSPVYSVHHGVHKSDKILGWVSQDRAPKAYDFAAANDLHIDWDSRGDAWIITVVVPSPDGESQIAEVTSENGARTLRLRSGYQLGLVVEASSQEKLRLSVTLGGPVEADTEAPDRLKVMMENGRVVFSGPFKEPREAFIPSGFYWEQRADGRWSPAYKQPGPQAYGY